MADFDHPIVPLALLGASGFLFWKATGTVDKQKKQKKQKKRNKKGKG